MRLYYDNKLGINIADNLVQHERTGPVEVDQHIIKGEIG